MSEGRLIAIGDIHGVDNKLANLLEKLSPNSSDKFVFLGDYIDRGDYSRQVVDRVINLSKICHCEFLLGNHEYFMLQTLKGEKTSEYFFMTYGGKQTIESYGGDIKNIMNIHGDFYNSLKLYYETDKFFFVHGGINPQKSLENQELMDLVMIREQFIDFPHNLQGKKVIFGHTPFSKPLVREDKIGIDTGCGKYDDAMLTAYICNENKFVQV